jgi:DNA-binding transcriptional ArsR family regulator
MISCLPDMYSSILAPTDASAAARFFRVLGDPTRLRILQLLEERERTVNELVAEVDQPQPRVSTHLACLRHCGFVETERRGKEIVYRLALDGLDGVLDRALAAMSPVAERLATCTRIGPDWV